MQTAYSRLWVLALVCALAACASAPKTPRQYFAATYHLIIATADSLASLTEAKKISKEVAMSGMNKLDTAKEITDEGRMIMVCREALKAAVDADSKCGSVPLAESRVSVARGIINQVQVMIGSNR